MGCFFFSSFYCITPVFEYGFSDSQVVRFSIYQYMEFCDYIIY